MFHLKGFHESLAGDEKEDAECTILMVTEGMNEISSTELETCISNLAGYEDVYPTFDENDAAIRFVFADSILEKTISICDHKYPPNIFYYDYFGRLGGWKDYERVRQLYATDETLDMNKWTSVANWKIRKKHPYYNMVKQFREWEHSRKHPNCECSNRPHLRGKFRLLDKHFCSAIHQIL